MATWNPDNVVLTQKGQEILSKVQAGVGKITVSKVVTGGGYVSPSLLYKQTAVTNEKQTMAITKVITDETGSEIALTVTNSELEQEYDLYQIGVYVQHQDYHGDILYTIAQCDTDNPDHIPLPSVTAATLQYSIYMEHSNTSNVVIQVNPAGFVTLDMIGAQNGVAGLDENGKVPQEQLPEMNYDPAGSAEAVREALEAHTGNQKNPHGVTAEQAGAAERNFLQETVFGLGSTSYNGWLEIGRAPINSTYRSLRVVFLVMGANGTGSGVLSLAIRVGSTAGSLENNETANSLQWLTLDRANIADKFAIAQEDGYAVLYFQIDGTWKPYHIGILGQAFGSEPFTDPASSDLFKLSDNYNLEGNHKDSITPFRTSSIGFTPEIMGAAKAEHTHAADDITSGTLNTNRLPTIPVNKGGTGKASWIANRLIYPSGSTALSQLAFPSSAGSVLRQGTSGAPYWTSLNDLRSAMGLSNAAKIETGHYTGTGNSGSSATANQITFGFEPKLVIIQRRNFASAIIFVTGTLLENNYKLNGWVPINIDDVVVADCFACKIGSSVKWYYSGSDSSDTDKKQFNVLREVYDYIGIG